MFGIKIEPIVTTTKLGLIIHHFPSSFLDLDHHHGARTIRRRYDCTRNVLAIRSRPSRTKSQIFARPSGSVGCRIQYHRGYATTIRCVLTCQSTYSHRDRDKRVLGNQQVNCSALAGVMMAPSTITAMVLMAHLPSTALGRA